jgi:hypothetical protein
MFNTKLIVITLIATAGLSACAVTPTCGTAGLPACATPAGGDGYRDQWASRPDLVTPDGEVIVRPDEVEIMPDDSTEPDGGPPGLGTPDDAPGNPEPIRDGGPAATADAPDSEPEPAAPVRG